VLSERQSTSVAANGMNTPEDRCGFGQAFERPTIDCPAFQRSQFIAATSYGKPLGTHVACAHLAVGELSTNQFYPRCSLGAVPDRMRWLGMMGPARLEVQRALGAEFERQHPDALRKLIAAKAAALAELPDSRSSRMALAAVVREFVGEFGAFVSTHATRIEELGFSASDLTDRAAVVLAEWQRSSRLDLPRGDGQPSRRPDALEPLTDGDQVSGAVTISRTASPASLTLVGSIDQTNLSAIDAALTDAMAAGDVVSIDLSDVTFCSVAGLRLLVRAAKSGAVTLAGMQPQLRRALAAAGLTGAEAGASPITDLEVAS
jgi:anti-anti-sigma factor